MPKFIAHGFTTKKWDKIIEAKNRYEASEKAFETWTEDDVWDTDTDVDVEELKE